MVDNHSQATETDRGHLGKSDNSIPVAKLLKGVEKSYDIGKKLLDESQTLTNGELNFRESNTLQQSQTQEVVSNHIDQAAKKVGGKVKQVNSIEEITNAQARKAIAEGRNVTGWFDETTGEVALYMPNIHDRYNAEKTVWHETDGHKGLRGIVVIVVMYIIDKNVIILLLNKVKIIITD